MTSSPSFLSLSLVLYNTSTRPPLPSKKQPANPSSLLLYSGPEKAKELPPPTRTTPTKNPVPVQDQVQAQDQKNPPRTTNLLLLLLEP